MFSNEGHAVCAGCGSDETLRPRESVFTNLTLCPAAIVTCDGLTVPFAMVIVAPVYELAENGGRYNTAVLWEPGVGVTADYAKGDQTQLWRVVPAGDGWSLSSPMTSVRSTLRPTSSSVSLRAAATKSSPGSRRPPGNAI